MLKSAQPRKQRKFRFTAPLHLKQKFLNVNLSEELRKTYKRRSIRIRKGDTVIVKKGSHKGKTGKIIKVNIKKGVVYIEGITKKPIRKEKPEKPIPFKPSNLEITALDLSDKKRLEKLKVNG